MTNPILNQKTLDNATVLESEPMTINGAINKTLILFGLLLAGSIVVWDAFLKGATDKVMLYGTIGFIVSIISYIAIMIKRDSAPIFAPVYAVAGGGQGGSGSPAEAGHFAIFIFRAARYPAPGL